MFQSSYLLPHFSVGQNVAVPLELAKVAPGEQASRVGALLDRAGIGHLESKAARKISGGERQRAAVVRAIVHDPRVVFADEPASNLDRQNAEVVLSLLADWRDGKLPYQSPGGERLLFLVSHNLRQVRRVRTDHFLLLFDGKVVGRRVYPETLRDNQVYEAIERGVVPESDGPPIATDWEPGS